MLHVIKICQAPGQGKARLHAMTTLSLMKMLQEVTTMLAKSKKVTFTRPNTQPIMQLSWTQPGLLNPSSSVQYPKSSSHPQARVNLINDNRVRVCIPVGTGLRHDLHKTSAFHTAQIDRWAYSRNIQLSDILRFLLRAQSQSDSKWQHP